MTSLTKNQKQRERYASDSEYREQILSRQREYMKTPEGRAKRLARKKRWIAANRDAYLEQCRRQNARRRERPDVMADNRRRVAEWQKANPGRVYESLTLKKYGLTLQDYLARLRQQRNRCAICGQHERARRPSGKRKRLAVDHCHVTGVVRGLLCTHCNHTLGRMGDDPRLLRRAADYLEGK